MLTIVGVLNVTPDSFYDGGLYVTVGDAVKRAKQMIADGADIIEIGGESTGPNAPAVSTDEELSRTMPILRELRTSFPDQDFSIDTYKSALAAAAIKEGVTMINDVTGGREDPAMFKTIAESSVSLVVMYAKDPHPPATIAQTQYGDVIATIKKFLAERVDAAVSAGISKDRLILDPGLGHFVSSDPHYSFEILRRLREFSSLGCPLFLSPSRKSFLAGPENLKTVDRLPGTIAASAIAVMNGATYIRTHDVREVRRGCEVALNVIES